MDAFINSASALSKVLLPILGAVVLVCLIILLIKIIKLVEKGTTSLTDVANLVNDVDKTVEKIQAPVDTVVKVAKTVDGVHDAGVKAVNDAKDFVVENVDVIKNKIKTFKKESSIKDDIVSKDENEVVYEENNNL